MSHVNSFTTIRAFSGGNIDPARKARETFRRSRRSGEMVTTDVIEGSRRRIARAMRGRGLPLYVLDQGRDRNLGRYTTFVVDHGFLEANDTGREIVDAGSRDIGAGPRTRD